MHSPVNPVPMILLLMALVSCHHGIPEIPVDESDKNPEVEGVSVWDRISTRSRPLRSAPRSTLLSLGERFIYLDSAAIDSANEQTRFLKVRLSDSTVVWVYDFASVLNARPAVMVNEVPLYLRPDLLTISDKKLNPMDIVAVTDEWDNWIRIVNEKKENTGWIKKEFVTYNPIDLAFALLAKRTLEEGDPQQRITNLEELLENNPYPQTLFIPELNRRLDMEKQQLRESEENNGREDNDRRERDRRERDR